MKKTDENFRLDDSITLQEKVDMIGVCKSDELDVLMDYSELTLENYIEIAKRTKSLAMGTFIKLYNTVEYISRENHDYKHLHIYLFPETMGYDDSNIKEIIQSTQRLLNENPYDWDTKMLHEMKVAYEDFCDFVDFLKNRPKRKKNNKQT